MAGTRKKLRLFLVILLLILVIALVVFIRYLSSPSKATNIAIEPSGSNASSSSSTFNMSPVKVTSQYADFTHPAGLTVMANQPMNGQELAEFNYQYKDVQWWQLVITVHRLLEPNIKSDTAYSFRKDNPGTYSESDLNVNGHLVAVMTDTQASDFSKVAILQSDTLSADISLTGEDVNGSSLLQSSLMQVVDSWHWN